MSLVKVSGNASGTGTLTIAAPNTNSDYTLTLPAATGTLISTASTFAGTGPAFSAYQSTAQTLTANTITKVQLQTEEFDTNSNFDNATNYRFLPTVSGYYQINGSLTTEGTRTYNLIYIYKNGSNFKISNAGNNTTGTGASISALIYFNGSSDYVELYALTGSTQNLNATAQETWFQASMVRSA